MVVSRRVKRCIWLELTLISRRWVLGPQGSQKKDKRRVVKGMASLGHGREKKLEWHHQQPSGAVTMSNYNRERGVSAILMTCLILASNRKLAHLRKGLAAIDEHRVCLTGNNIPPAAEDKPAQGDREKRTTEVRGNLANADGDI